MNLIDLGYRDELAYDGDETYLARVIREHKGHYTIQSTEATYQAVVRGRLHHEAQSRLELPAVGDWVEITPQAHGQAMIERLIPRFSAITRKVAGLKTEAQIIAANVTKVFIVISSAEPLNKRKLERYLSVVWDSGASPIVVLSKADLSEAAEEIKQEVIDLAHGSPVELWSAETEVGKAGLFELIHPADTIVLMGSSGVGKSTLLNALFAEEKEKTGAIREHDQRGRHTTTHRELHVLPTGGIVIDTPGMREMQLWSSDNSGEDASFSDIVSLKKQCRFSNCSHTSEPDCAISQALADQTLEQGRWNNYLKLQREKAYAERKQSARLASEQKKQWKKQTANRKRHK